MAEKIEARKKKITLEEQLQNGKLSSKTQRIEKKFKWQKKSRPGKKKFKILHWKNSYKMENNHLNSGGL